MLLNSLALGYILDQIKNIAVSFIPKKQEALTEKQKQVLATVDMWESDYRPNVLKFVSALLDFDLAPYYNTGSIAFQAGMIVVPLKAGSHDYKLNEPIYVRESGHGMRTDGTVGSSIPRIDKDGYTRFATPEEIGRFISEIRTMDRTVLAGFITMVISKSKIEIVA